MPPPLAPIIPPVSLAIGLTLIITGCASSAIGLALMKQSSEVEGHLPCSKRWRWLMGFVFLVVNATVLDLIAYGLIPLAIIAPFAGLTMVFSLILAVSGLIHERETLSVSQGFAALLVIIGVVVASHFGPHSSANVDSMDEILRDFHDGHFLAFAAITLGQVALYLAVLHLPSLAWLKPPKTSPLTTAFSAYTASVCGALSQLFMKVVSLALQTLGSKGVVVLQQPTVYIAVAGLASTAPLQLYLLNATLASSPVSYAVPLYMSLLVMLTTAAGGIFFKEFAQSTVASNLAYGCGGLLAITGLAILGHAAHASQSKSKGESQNLLAARRTSSMGSAGELESIGT